MALGLRFRLLLPLAVLLMGLLGVTGWTAWSAAQRTEERIARQLDGVSRTLSQSSFPLTLAVLEQMKGLSGGEFILFSRGKSPLTTIPSLARLPLDRFPAQAVVANHLGSPVRVAGTSYRYRRLPLAARGRFSGGTLVILYAEQLRQQAIFDAIRPVMILGGVAGGLGVAGMWLLGGWLVARIRRLEQRTRGIAAGDFRPLPLPEGRDELHALAYSINEMAGQLATLHEVVRQSERLRVWAQVSEGLAHQLKNNLQNLQLLLDLQESAAEPETWAVLRRELTVMQQNVRRFLSRTDPATAEQVPCDLNQLVRDSITMFGPRCRHRGITLASQLLPAAMRLLGDPLALGDVLANLLANAIDAVPLCGEIVVCVTRELGEVAITVWDNGPGPPKEIGDRLFEPYVTGKPQGLGLGLAVAQQAATAHGGNICWGRTKDRTWFRLSLPEGPPPIESAPMEP